MSAGSKRGRADGTAFHLLMEPGTNTDPMQVAIPSDWMQGRTAFGGLSAALGFMAAKRVLGTGWPLRSAQFAFIAPLSGTVEVSANIERMGRNAAFVRTNCRSINGIGLGGMLVFARERPSQLSFRDLPRPESLNPEDSPALPHRPQLNLFTGHFDYRPARKGAAGLQPEIFRWVRVRERDGLCLPAELLLVGDALPPAGLSQLPARPAASSLNWSINILNPRAETKDGWWLVRSRTNFAESGLSSQSMTIWNREGEPIAEAMQSVSIFG